MNDANIASGGRQPPVPLQHLEEPLPQQGADAPRSPGKRYVRLALPMLVLAGVAFAVWYGFFHHREPGDDLGRLQGVWKVEAYGRETQSTIRVEGDRWTYSAGGMQGLSYRLTLRPDASPKEIDLVLLNDTGEPVAFTHGAAKGSPVSLHGIYSIEGETVRVVLVPGVEERPKSMDEVSEAQVMTLHRLKT